MKPSIWNTPLNPIANKVIFGTAFLAAASLAPDNQDPGAIVMIGATGAALLIVAFFSFIRLYREHTRR